VGRNDESARGAYLARLGLDPEPPSAAALFRLHRAHVERVPYETVWIHLGERWGVGVADSYDRIANHGRGGYCFHLNGAFSELLRSLGYDVVRHVGGVHGPDGPTGDEMTNHLVLTVHDLPDETNPAGDWYVDVGLGDALHDALPLRAGAYDQHPFHLSLDVVPTDGVGDWHLTHDPDGGFTGMSWHSAPTELDAFADRNEWLSTSADSGFVQVMTVQRRDATGIDVLRGLSLQRIGTGAHRTTVASAAELTAVLHDLFGLRLDAQQRHALDARWPQLLDAQRAWEATQPG
jgi:N-hydroxyarylamine O-acetyltransferase